VKVVICGSYGDMSSFLQILSIYQKEFGEANVFPTYDHLNKSKTCVEAHHDGKGETHETIALRSVLMAAYFKAIDNADLVVIVNEKNGIEHYGVGTTLELGYAFSRHKLIRFVSPPTNANIQSLF